MMSEVENSLHLENLSAIDEIPESEVQIESLPHEFIQFPTSIQNQIQQLIFYVNTLEEQIYNTRTNSKNLLTGIMEIIHRIEMVIFDLFFLLNIYTDKIDERVMDFISDCFNVSMFKDESGIPISDIENHFQQMVTLIKDIIDNVRSLQGGNITFSPHTQNNDPIYNRLMEIRKINKKYPKKAIPQKDRLPYMFLKTIDTDANSETSLEFGKFLLNNSKFDLFSDKSIELRGEIGAMACKLTVFKSLQEKLTSLFKIANINEQEYYSYSQAIVSSPYYITLREKLFYARDMFCILDNELQLNKIISDIEKNVKKQIEELNTIAISTISALKKQDDVIKESIATKKNKLLTMTNVNTLYKQVNLLFDENRWEFVQNTTKVTNLIRQVQDLARSSEKKMDYIQKTINTLHELNASFQALQRQNNEIVQVMKKVQYKDKMLFELYAENQKTTNLISKLQINGTTYKQHSSTLKKTLETIKPLNISNTVRDINAMLVKNKKSRQDLMVAQDHMFDEFIIENQEQRIQGLSNDIINSQEMLSKINNALVETKKNQTEQQAFRLRKQLQGIKERPKVSTGASISQSHYTAQYIRKVMCPSCKKNMRDSIIVPCGHCFCSQCLAGMYQCPSCGGKCEASTIKSLKFQ